MAKLHVERIGGLAGFGGPSAHVRSHGEIDMADLTTSEQSAVEELFRSHGTATTSQARDAFHYRISRTTPKGVETIEIPEAVVPAAISHCVKDELI